MPISSLASALVKASLFSQEIAVQVERRRELYGGGIDTVLLEMGLLDEEILVTHLANFTGIPAAPLERLAKPDLDAGLGSTRALQPAWARFHRPARRRAGTGRSP